MGAPIGLLGLDKGRGAGFGGCRRSVRQGLWQADESAPEDHEPRPATYPGLRLFYY